MARPADHGSFPDEGREHHREELGRFRLAELPSPIPLVLDELLLAGGGDRAHAKVIAVQVEVEHRYLIAMVASPLRRRSDRAALLRAVARHVLERRGLLTRP